MEKGGVGQGGVGVKMYDSAVWKPTVRLLSKFIEQGYVEFSNIPPLVSRSEQEASACGPKREAYKDAWFPDIPPLYLDQFTLRFSGHPLFTTITES